MARRRHSPYHSLPPQQNLDSFLDILTNTVGALMFIGLFITLVTVESAAIIQTPLVKTSNKQVHLFELRGEQVLAVDTQTVQTEVERQLQALPTCPRPQAKAEDYGAYLAEFQNYQACLLQQSEHLAKLKVETADYQVTLVNVDNFAFQYTPKAGKQSDPPLQSAESPFAQQLQALDPQRDYVAFVVRPDAFRTFRQARKLAQRQGFDIGWEPLATETPLILGSEGRRIGVQ
ncbi:hypothetical protein [Synechocystis sp. LKSZ1]|uniref:hypothetical protein n=1 Tax=Synechocystis sp. LKSZ1 TaxID=3144951 RepID=UPI00336BC403